jgi:signal transduction histidine kinase
MTVVVILVLVLVAAALVLARSRSLRRFAAAEATASAATAEAGRLRGEMERLQRLLAQRDRLSAVGMLAASVTHEVRNPLVSVRTFVQLLPERLHDEEFRTSFRDLALAEIDRICALINDLLAFARPGPPPADIVPDADVNETLGQIHRLLDVEAKKRGITLAAELDPALPRVRIDESRIKQVLLNVVLNAIQACERRAEVTVSSRSVRHHGSDYVQVEVRDTGPGIAADHLARIFDPFFTTKEGGSGLGLFIARQIVADYDGFMEVRSLPGSGSVFALHFPRAPVAVRTVPAGTDPAAQAELRAHRASHG